MRWALSVVLLFLPACAAAQTCTQTVPISVLDQKTGLFIPSLQSGVFHAQAGKTVLPVVALNPIKTFRILVLIDASGSMGQGNDPGIHFQEAIQITEEALIQFVKEFPEVSVQYGFFSRKTIFTNRFTAHAHELLSDIEDAKTKFGKIGFGGTAIYDAVHQAGLRFQPIQPGDSIVLLTDGVDEDSKLRDKDVKEGLRGSGIRLFTLLVMGPPIAPNAEGRKELDSLADATGGAFIKINAANYSWGDKKAVAENIKALRLFWTEQVLNGYLLSLQLPTDSKKDHKWILTLNLPARGQLKNVVLRYPNRLPGCSVSTASAH
jgi:hypothetical protein